MPEVLEDV